MLELDDLILRATEDDSPATTAALLAAIPAQDASGRTIADHLALLLESWGEGVAVSKTRAEFCFSLAARAPDDTPQLRAALQRALRCLFEAIRVPRTIAVEALGLRDAAVAPVEIARRFQCLRHLRPELLAAVPEQNSWGRILAVDEFTGEVRLQPMTGTPIAFPLPQAIRLFLLFRPAPELVAAFAAPAQIKLPDAPAWRQQLEAATLAPLDAATGRRISFLLLVPARFDIGEFDAWWQAVAPTTAMAGLAEAGAGRGGATTPLVRTPGSARSLAELLLLLTAFDRAAPPTRQLAPTEAVAIARLLTTAKPPANAKAEKDLAAITVILANRLAPDLARETLAPLRRLASWWPKAPASIPGEAPAWSGMAVAQMPAMIHATRLLFPDDYCLALLLRLPPKCWPAAVAELGIEMVREFVAQAPPPPAAAAAYWWWKNFPEDRLPWSGGALLKALANADETRAAAARQLRDLILDRPAFQHAMLAVTDGREHEFLNDLQHAKALSQGEKQSLMVKLARLSPAMQAAIETGGQGKSMMAATPRTADQAEQAATEEAAATLVTSVRSYRQRIRELEDLINRQLPENTAAIAHARGYGDLRENAEYKAAKEQQRLLTKRHQDLRRDLNAVQAIDFSLVHPDQTVIPGSLVTLTLDQAQPELKYFLLGAWDGNPELHHLACNTPLGKALVGHRQGDLVVLPDGREARIATVAALPEKLLHELNEPI